MLSAALLAGTRTYTFTSASWGSKTLSGTCDNRTDGWVSDKAGYGYNAGYYNAEDRLYSAGVQVSTSVSPAGATSVLRFESVTAVTFNLCLNSSKGRGVIYVDIDHQPADSLVITKPATSGSGVYNRDSTIVLSAPASGQVSFRVKCTENSIYIHSITIHASDSDASEQTEMVFRRVGSVNELLDGDTVMIGVPSEKKLMSYFDETFSQNNIRAIGGSFSHDGSICYGALRPYSSEDAYYTIHRVNDSVFYLQDEEHYEEAYLVASGGQTKNRLAVWTHLYDEGTYGPYGYWVIRIEGDSAIIRNCGNSLAKYIQYNPNAAVSINKSLFACYPTPYLYTPSIYRLHRESIITSAPQTAEQPARASLFIRDGRLYIRHNNQISPL